MLSSWLSYEEVLELTYNQPTHRDISYRTQAHFNI